MAALTFCDSFVIDLEDAVHDLNADTLRYTATNTTPNVATMGQLSDLTVIDVNTFSSETWPYDAGNASTSTGGVTTVTGLDATITATGTVPEFRYIWLYNDTATNDELIGYWDNGSAVNLASGQVFTLNLTTNVLLTVNS